jgi:GNAT superfamily N-acetyltransferase
MVRSLMKKGQFLLAEDDSKLVGSIYMEIRGERGYFGMLSIEPSRQGTGIGHKLANAVEKEFRDAGCKMSDLKIVNVRTELHILYRRWGYVDTGTAVYDDPTPTKIPVHFINMSKQLL